MAKSASSQRRNARAAKEPSNEVDVIDLTHSHPTLTEKHSEFPARPAEGFPDGWVIRDIPRTNKATARRDYYYYSPEMSFKFKSRPEVKRFLECLEESNGNESVAIGMFRGTKASSTESKRGKSRNPTASKKAAAKSSEANVITVDDESDDDEHGDDNDQGGKSVRDAQRRPVTNNRPRPGSARAKIAGDDDGEANQQQNNAPDPNLGAAAQITRANDDSGKRNANNRDTNARSSTESTPRTSNRPRTGVNNENESSSNEHASDRASDQGGDNDLARSDGKKNGSDGGNANERATASSPILARNAQRSTPRTNSNEGKSNGNNQPAPTAPTHTEGTPINNRHQFVGATTTSLNAPLLPTPSPGKMGQSLGETAENLTMILGHLTIGGTLEAHHWRGLNNIAVNLTRMARHLGSVEQKTKCRGRRRWSMGRTSTDTTTSSEWENMFDLKEGEWRCARCLHENSEDDANCLNCNFLLVDGLKTPRDDEETTKKMAGSEGALNTIAADIDGNDGGGKPTASSATSSSSLEANNNSADVEEATVTATSATTSKETLAAEGSHDEIAAPPTPEPEPRTLPEVGWGDFFKLRPGEWRCKTCLVVNPKGKADCLCCVSLDNVGVDDDDEATKPEESLEDKLNAVTKERDLARDQLRELTEQQQVLLENIKQQDATLQDQDEQILCFVLQQNKQELKLSAATKEIEKLQNYLSNGSSCREDGVGAISGIQVNNTAIHRSNKSNTASNESSGTNAPPRNLNSAPNGANKSAASLLTGMKATDCNKEAPPALAGLATPFGNKKADTSSTTKSQSAQKHRPALRSISNRNGSVLKPPSKFASNVSSKTSRPTSSSKGRTRVKFATPSSNKVTAPTKRAARNKPKHNSSFIIFEDCGDNAERKRPFELSGLSSKEKFGVVGEPNYTEVGVDVEGGNVVSAMEGRPSRKSYDRLLMQLG